MMLLLKKKSNKMWENRKEKAIEIFPYFIRKAKIITYF